MTSSVAVVSRLAPPRRTKNKAVERDDRLELPTVVFMMFKQGK